ncbi:MAG: hypothetical protein ACTHN5_01655 [Phycisphaerae bacterium]
MASVQKICVGCSADVANQKRVKDAQGNYYCQGCYEARLAEKKAGARAAQPEPVAAAAAAAPDPYDFPPEPQDIGEIGLAEPPQELAPEPAASDLFGCADCKKLVPSSQIRNDDGEFVCSRCFSKRRTMVRPRTSSTTYTAASTQAPAKATPLWLTLLYIGGGIFATIVLMLAISYFLPDLSRKVFGWTAVVGVIIFFFALRWATYIAAADNLPLRLACRYIPLVGIVVVIRRSLIDWGEMQAAVFTTIGAMVVAVAAGAFWFGIAVTQEAAKIQARHQQFIEQMQHAHPAAADKNAADDNADDAAAPAADNNAQPAAPAN